MKDERGITLIALIIYVIILTIVVAIVSNITTSFYSNVNEFDSDTESVVSILKFNMYFVKDIKRDEVTVKDIKNNYIILSYYNENGVKIDTQYSMQNNSLYRDKVKICSNVDNVEFSMQDENVIKINFKIGDYEKTATYVIENLVITNNNRMII